MRTGENRIENRFKRIILQRGACMTMRTGENNFFPKSYIEKNKKPNRNHVSYRGLPPGEKKNSVLTGMLWEGSNLHSRGGETGENR